MGTWVSDALACHVAEFHKVIETLWCVDRCPWTVEPGKEWKSIPKSHS